MTLAKFFKSNKMAIIVIIALLATAGCDDNKTTQKEVNLDDTAVQNQDNASLASSSSGSNGLTNSANQFSQDSLAPIEIDWSNIDSGVSPASLEGYNYPIAIDSDPVKAYAKHQGISLEQAQHNIVLGTASNEPLLALFDELDDSYVSHSLSEGDKVALVVKTTANVTPSHYDYVIKEDFAKGLVLPIIVTHDGAENDVENNDVESIVSNAD